jgi:O-acetylserine/cysteine efflux transporter
MRCCVVATRSAVAAPTCGHIVTGHMRATLPLRHLLLALLTVAIWGFNFVAIKTALTELPPLLLCALRFLFVAIPAVFFIKRPAIPVRQLLLYGVLMFALHFGFLFLGMGLGMSAGLASLVIQVQVFVTIALATIALKERPSRPQIVGAVIACGGLALVGLHAGGDVSLAGLVCVLLAAVSWGNANLLSKRLGKVNALALVVWGGLVVPVPMLAASALFEGPSLMWRSIAHLSTVPALSLAFIVYVSTLVGFSLWSWLLARHPAATIAPFALLVPVVGMLSSALALGEALPAWKFQAAALVIAGLAVNLFGPRGWSARRPAVPAPAAP